MTFISQDDPAFESLCRAYQLVGASQMSLYIYILQICAFVFG